MRPACERRRRYSWRRHQQRGSLLTELAELRDDARGEVREFDGPPLVARDRRGGEHGVADVPAGELAPRGQPVQVARGQAMTLADVRRPQGTAFLRRREGELDDRARLLLVSTAIPSKDSMRCSR